MSLSNPIEAEKYIQRHAKGKAPNSSLGIEVEDGKINVDSRKTIHADHMRLAESLTKFINMTPNMNPISKKIMTMKIVNPGYTSDSVAIILGLRKVEVEAYELDGKNRVKEYMCTTDFNDCIKKFEQNGVVERAVKNCFAKDSKIIRQ
jgi:hypothetical protein